MANEFELDAECQWDRRCNLYNLIGKKRFKVQTAACKYSEMMRGTLLQRDKDSAQFMASRSESRRYKAGQIQTMPIVHEQGLRTLWNKETSNRAILEQHSCNSEAIYQMIHRRFMFYGTGTVRLSSRLIW
jgi:hypothetical protein